MWNDRSPLKIHVSFTGNLNIDLDSRDGAELSVTDCSIH